MSHKRGDEGNSVTQKRVPATSPFKESHEKDVERLTPDRRCETESKEAHTLKNTTRYDVLT
jgi:hypothetical protein